MLDSADSAGRILRVEFVWREDRYAHVISAIDTGGSRELLLESIEGTPADEWPPSPPLQSLHRETLQAGGTAILLVGSAGRSHWSASSEALPAEGALTFDIACRHGGGSGWLGSRYRTHPGAKARLTIDAASTSWTWSAELLEITPQSGPTLTARWKYTLHLRS